jgi:uncharacterized protein YbbC (DUF1343 family)
VTRSPTVRTGLDRVGDDARHLVAGRRLALLAHPASVDAAFRPARAVLEAAGATIEVLLGPEHGLSGEAQDMEQVGTERRAKGPRIYSLYGATEASLRPTAEMLDGVDLLVIDLQDVGSRYYTFVWTALLCLETCASLGLPALVLDRPNPIGGLAVEGPAIDVGFGSFVGLHDVPTRHGLTVGELLTLALRERGLAAGLDVVAMSGWRRGLRFDETGLPWVMPSPNMPSLDTALVYPGLCLIEGTDASEGRGTTRPFEIIGAPWVDGEALAASLGQEALPGCAFRPLRFKPMFHKHAGRVCGGVQVHVTDRDRFRPLRAGVAIIRALWQLGGAGGGLRWRTEPYEFVADRPAIDLLAGGTWLREGVEAGAALDDLCGAWPREEDAFRHRREASLLYGE